MQEVIIRKNVPEYAQPYVVVVWDRESGTYKLVGTYKELRDAIAEASFRFTTA